MANAIYEADLDYDQLGKLWRLMDPTLKPKVTMMVSVKNGEGDRGRLQFSDATAYKQHIDVLLTERP